MQEPEVLLRRGLPSCVLTVLWRWLHLHALSSCFHCFLSCAALISQNRQYYVKINEHLAKTNVVVRYFQVAMLVAIWPRVFATWPRVANNNNNYYHYVFVWPSKFGWGLQTKKNSKLLFGPVVCYFVAVGPRVKTTNIQLLVAAWPM